MSIFISWGQTSTSFLCLDNPEQTALYLHSVLSPFGCQARLGEESEQPGGPALPQQTDVSQVYMCGWHQLAEASFHFPKGQVRVIPANTGKLDGFCPLTKPDQAIPVIFPTTNDKQLRSMWTWECNLSKTELKLIALLSIKPVLLMTPAQTFSQSEQMHCKHSPL